MINKLFGGDSGKTRFAVYASGLLLALVTILRVIDIHINGTPDMALLQLQQALVTLFTGSIVLDRSQIHRNGGKDDGSGPAI